MRRTIEPILAAVTRGRFRESEHRGQLVVTDTKGRILWQTPGLDRERPVFLRSAAKPLQALPLLESGGAAAFRITGRELAVICASHSGEPAHVAAVAGLLRKGRLKPGCLLCGTHVPYAPKAAAALARSGRKPGPLCHNCSGIHAGMLLTCLHRGWPIGSYLDPRHPLQREIRQIVADFADLKFGEVAAAKDGCNLPAFGISLPRMAMTYARLASPEFWVRRGDAIRGAATARITAAMRQYPWILSGTGRTDLALMTSAAGRLFSKIGAEAVWCLGFPDEGLGLALKVSDGANRAEPVIIAEALRQTGLLDAAARRTFLQACVTTIASSDGSLVGRYEAPFTLVRPG
jgi:L-asparaginase II